jgi:H+/Cl- antiporter ClcA
VPLAIVPDSRPAPRRATVTDEPEAGPALPPLAQSPIFWLLLRYAAVFGVILAFAGLAFLGVTQGGGELWFELSDAGWMGGDVWWVAVTAAFGVLVGLLRRAFKVSDDQPGMIKELEEQRVEPADVPGTVSVSAVSLIGGASLGPEAALGSIGGGLGTWISERRGLDPETQKTNTMTGMAGAYGGLLSAPFLATMLVLELAKPSGRRLTNTLIAGLVASTVSFAVFIPIAGAAFLGIYELPDYKYEDWHLLAAVPLGLAAGVIALVLAVTVGLLRRLMAPLAGRVVLRSTLGGLAFGLVAVALPLTLFTGSDQLETVIDQGPELGAGLLIAVVFAKILAFALSMSTGFIGGPFFPSLFIGGTAGFAAHLLIPGLPVGLAFTTMFAAVPGAIVAAPFTVVLLAALTTQLGALQTAPIGVAVITAYIFVSGSGILLRLASRHSPPDA